MGLEVVGCAGPPLWLSCAQCGTTHPLRRADEAVSIMLREKQLLHLIVCGNSYQEQWKSCR